MSTAPMMTPGGDHLVETGLVTRGWVSVRMDTRRLNIRRGYQNHQQEPTTPLIEPLSLPIQTSLPLSESDQSNLVGNFDLLGVVSSCLPACLVSVVRPPCDLYIYTSTYTNYDFKH